MNHTGLSAKIADYITGRAVPKLEEFDKKAEKKRQAAQDAEELVELEQVLAEERQELEGQFKPVNWLTDAARRTRQIQMVTHALKFTHPDAKGSSWYAPGGPSQPAIMNDGELLSTASLDAPNIDAVGNAAALDVVKLLQLEHGGKTLLECIEQNDTSPLRPFAKDQEQADQWLEGFREAFVVKELSSHKLAKQIYFPVGNGQYHLLSPIFSSSLAGAIYGRIADSRYSDTAKSARKAKRESRYSDVPVVDYPGIALQSYGGTKPQNISYFNSVRGGRSFLLSSIPPTWATRPKPPLGVRTVFSRNHFGLRVHRKVWSFQQYLLRQIDKRSTKSVRDQRAERIDELVDQLIQYAAEIQSLSEQAGWSASPECKLSLAEQLWLDPGRARSEDTFAQERDRNNWQTAIADAFARWLNNRIKHEKLTPGDVEHREWQSLVKEKMRLLQEDLEDMC